MGVSGSGKTTVGEKLAQSLNYEFADADDFHPPDNIDKMRHGIPLNDADRIPWLESIQNAIKAWITANRNVILACSALKASYRQKLLLDSKYIKLIYLKGSFEVIQGRLQQRQNHFMSEKLLGSQFDDLEEPADAISVDVSKSVENIVQDILEKLRM